MWKASNEALKSHEWNWIWHAALTTSRDSTGPTRGIGIQSDSSDGVSVPVDPLITVGYDYAICLMSSP